MGHVTLIAVTATMAVGTLLIAFHLREILAVIFLGIVLGLTCAPVADYFSRWRVPRAVSVLGIYLVIAAPVGIFLWFAVPDMLAEVNRLAESSEEL